MWSKGIFASVILWIQSWSPNEERITLERDENVCCICWKAKLTEGLFEVMPSWFRSSGSSNSSCWKFLHPKSLLQNERISHNAATPMTAEVMLGQLWFYAQICKLALNRRAVTGVVSRQFTLVRTLTFASFTSRSFSYCAATFVLILV